MTRRASIIPPPPPPPPPPPVMFVWFAVRTDERCSRSEARNHEAHKRFEQDFVRRGK